MDLKKKHRRVLRTTFTRSARELDNLLSAPEVEIRSIKASLDLLRQKIEDLRRIDEEIYNLFLTEDASEEDLLAEMESSDSYYKKFSELSIHCEDRIQPKVTSPIEDEVASRMSGNSVDSSQGKRKFKLPTLEFKKFDGNIKNWLPFWSQFQKVHIDSDIDLNDKVEYLIQATTPGSRARQLVDSFPATGTNYTKMIDCLISRFGRDDLQIDVYVRELLKLVISNTSSGNKLDLSLLYDKLETQLRALETLGIKSDKYAAMLFPLVESCLPSDLLRVWQRLPEGVGSQASINTAGVATLENRLKSLMLFLKNEVDNEQHIYLAEQGFNLKNGKEFDFKRTGPKMRRNEENGPKFPSAMGLINSNTFNQCVFCDNAHDSCHCFKAQKLSYEQKTKILAEKGACFRCLKHGHQSRKCRSQLSCLICHRSHVTLMCRSLPTNKVKNNEENQIENDSNIVPKINQSLANSATANVFLQTLRIEMNHLDKSRVVRALIDTGSQKTYILKSTAGFLGYPSKRQINLVHGLFGGSELVQKHDCYDVTLSYNDYSCTFEALDQPVICSNVSSVFNGSWMEELSMLNIQISDSNDTSPIEVLIGADIAGKLYTGRRHILKCGLVAVETLLGWTLMGKVPVNQPGNHATTTVSLFISAASITNLWELDALGINDPAERKSKEETALAAKELFFDTVSTDSSGRYEARLPWLEGHPALPSNYHLAKKRLESTLKKITKDGYLEAYGQIFRDWLDENIIEEVFEKQPNQECHYLPHRPVIKPNSLSTKIRPVFDASAKEKDNPSLNQCLEKGVNLIELIPAILLRFRQQEIGVISDICKAFLQIGIHETDRDFLRFLWTDDTGKEKVYRHRRVVFGISSSPFLLGATLEHHFSLMLEKFAASHLTVSRDTIVKLSNSFYVDNCVTSVANLQELNTFIKESNIIMAEGRFDLRGWEYTGQIQNSTINNFSQVLGIKWNKMDDTLCLKHDDEIDQLFDKPITKRVILSQAQRVFDPIGYTCPASLLPKMLLQRTWKEQLSWDAPVDSAIEMDFLHWVKELPYLAAIQIPRWIHAGDKEAEELTLHTFCDASKDAYSAVIFLRGTRNGQVFVHLLTAKARVAPLKTLSIPRLELMAAVIAVRLYATVKENLKIKLDEYFWSDSTTVLSWIRKAEEWTTFVWNRVAEIRKTSCIENWHHIPGFLNPADLPSRGCSPRQLLESKWWEGPQWLYQMPSSWPREDLSSDEEEINKEKKKKLVTVLINSKQDVMTLEDWHLYYFSQYLKILRMCAWVYRFIHNTRNKYDKHIGDLTSEEVGKAETLVLKLVQRESFTNENDKRLCGMGAFKDEHGLIRLKSRISNRNDHEYFRFPIVLPAKHFLVNRLLFQEHVKSCHVGTQGLMSIVRERYWVLGGRRAVKSAIAKCVVCKRHNAKSFEASTPPLPEDRVRDAVAFEITGVDFAGPLYLINGEKAWICLFTCAVYRAVHLELCTSLSVTCFMQALRRFIARRGRPKTIYSDNGTNFVGTENAFRQVDFQEIAENGSAERIQWRFNPPIAAWWGGFWERLVGVLKQLLRKVLGRASLDYESLLTVLCDCESVINSRPITCLSTDANELIPLTPQMFLRDQAKDGVPDCDAVDSKTLSRKVLHRQKLLQDLRQRFRSEYLGQLKLWSKKDINNRVKVGEIVFVGNDQDKRVNWPLGRIIDVLPGRDGQIRLVRISTERGQFLRPIQRLYPVECSADFIQKSGDNESIEVIHNREPHSEKMCKSAKVLLEGDAETEVSKSRVPETQIIVTRSGREVKLPVRYCRR